MAGVQQHGTGPPCLLLLLLSMMVQVQSWQLAVRAATVKPQTLAGAQQSRAVVVVGVWGGQAAGLVTQVWCLFCLHGTGLGGEWLACSTLPRCLSQLCREREGVA